MRLTVPLSSRTFPILSIGLAVVMSALSGCTEPGGVDATEADPEALLSDNGLKSINGMRIHNGLATGNGLSLASSLKSPASISSTTGLMTSADGRNTLSYLVRCALPPGHTISKADQYGRMYSFAGQVGVAPEWETGACGGACERWVSACMLALVNTTGDHYPLWLVAQNAAIGWNLDPTFPLQEGAFFGDIFTPEPYAYFCGGRDYGVAPIPGRIGSSQVGAPYTNAFGPGGKCLPTCTPADVPHQLEGVKACSGWNEVVNVWHQ